MVENKFYKYIQGDLVKIDDHLDQLVDQILAGIAGSSDVFPFSQLLELARAKVDEELSEIQLVILVARSKKFQIIELFESDDSPAVPYVWDLRKLNQTLRKKAVVPVIRQIINGTADVDSLVVDS